MNKSFTLIEILVVIVVIGVLSAFILVGMSSITSSANIAKGQAHTNSIRNSLLLNLISEWKFDTNANDSWKANNGTVSGAALVGSNCIKGSCYNFDGVDDYIQVSDNSQLRMIAGGTISAWIYPRTSGEGTLGRIIDKSTGTAAHNGYRLLTFENNTLYFQINSGTALITSNNSTVYNRWQLITVTFNSSGRKIYVNGIDKTSTGGGETALPPDFAGVITIGNRASNTDYTYDGYIDEFTMYDAVFSTSQIQQNYFIGLNNLYKNKGLTQIEYNQRIVELKSITVGDY